MMVPNSGMPDPRMITPKATQGKNVPEELLDCGKDCVDPEVCVENGCVLYGDKAQKAPPAEMPMPPMGQMPEGEIDPFQ